MINGYKRKRATTATAAVNSRVEELEQHKVPSAQDVIVDYCWLMKFKESTSSRVLGLRSWLDAWSFLLPHQTGTIVDVLIQSYWYDPVLFDQLVKAIFLFLHSDDSDVSHVARFHKISSLSLPLLAKSNVKMINIAGHFCPWCHNLS